MPVLDVINVKKEKVSEVEAPETIWDVPVTMGVLHQVVCAQLAARRQGTASTKTRSEVRGGGKKPYRQKGTGRARAGTRTSPVWRGGGRALAPKPRTYDQKVPKKVRRLALCMALSDKRRSERVCVLDEFGLSEIKTKLFNEALNGLELKNALILTSKDDEILMKSARNVPNVKVLHTNGLNVYDILKYENLIVLEPAMEAIKERLARNEGTA
jgi:large subunit ribosomal protein L4